MEVQKDFHLAAIDAVTDPSGPNCFVKGIMENTEYYFDLATSSWMKSAGVSTVTEEIIEEVEKTKDVDFVSKKDFEDAMKRLDVVEGLIKGIKENYISKPDRKTSQVDESTALHIFESFISTLKK